MKGRESGMPEENYWDTFFNAECIVRRLVCPYAGDNDIVEFGSGYGTFTIPALQCNSGTVYTFDIEPELVDLYGIRQQMRRYLKFLPILDLK